MSQPHNTRSPSFSEQPTGTHRDNTGAELASVLVIYTGGTIGMANTEHGYSPQAGLLLSLLKSMPMFHDPTAASSLTPDLGEILVTPMSIFGRRVQYQVMEYNPLLDSSNMDMKDWKHIATDIYKHYRQFDGFVVLHGTDTMAYTASALSFMFENLGKTVVLTGSQIPMSEQRNDARENFLGALTIAGHFCIPEVLLLFHNRLLRGNRSSKVNASAYDAFDSPNLAPLAKLGITIDVEWSLIFRPREIKTMSVSTTMDEHVGALRLFPGIAEVTVRGFLKAPIKGVVLQTYGAGNAPDNRKELLQAFADATASGIVIVNCTQCSKGVVVGHYASGQALYETGVIAGGDMTTECALTKLSYLFGKGLTPHQVRELMVQNIRGELTITSKKNKFSMEDITFVRKLATAVQAVDDGEVSQLSRTLMPTLMCAAAGKGDVVGLTGMVNGGFDVNCCDYDRRSPLHVAASEGKLPSVEFLLLNGANVHARDRLDRTPLLDAIQGKHSSVVALLVQAGAYLVSTPEKAAYLCQAAAENNTELLQLFIFGQMDVNVGDYDGRRAIHLAVAEGHVDAVKLLLKVSQINLTVVDRWGNTPLSEAKRRPNNAEIVSLLTAAIDAQKPSKPQGGALKKIAKRISHAAVGAKPSTSNGATSKMAAEASWSPHDQ